jgi:hypothetical protein
LYEPEVAALENQNLSQQAKSEARSKIKTETRARLTKTGQAFSELLRPAAREGTRTGGRAYKTNTGVNVGARLTGPALLLVGAAISAHRIATAAPEERAGVVAEEAGAWTGALAFGSAGATIGGLVGGPVGALAGGLIGGVVGGILGAMAGRNVYDEF